MSNAPISRCGCIPTFSVPCTVSRCYIYIYYIYIVIYICLHECVFSKMDQNDAVAIYKKSYHELSLFGEAPVCSSTIIGSEAYVLPGLTNSPVGPSPDSVAQRVAAESWVAHMVCCGWYLCASLQTAVPSLGRGWWDLGRPNLLDPFRMGKCRRIQENAIVTGSCFVSNLNPKKDPNFDVAWFKRYGKCSQTDSLCNRW
jgi:hypothetical protein